MEATKDNNEIFDVEGSGISLHFLETILKPKKNELQSIVRQSESIPHEQRCEQLPPLQKKFRAALDDLCNILISDAVLCVQQELKRCKNQGTKGAAGEQQDKGWAFFRLAEVEVYCNTRECEEETPTAAAVAAAANPTPTTKDMERLSGVGLHVDTFTHGDPQQQLCGTFYFHKKGGTYKGGSFKGMDITLGPVEWNAGNLSPSAASATPTLSQPQPQEDEKGEVGAQEGSGKYRPRPFYLGLLVRSIVPLTVSSLSPVPEEMVEGPCLVVDRILKTAGFSSIKELVGNGSDALTIAAAAAGPQQGLSTTEEAKLVRSDTTSIVSTVNANRGLLRLVSLRSLRKALRVLETSSSGVAEGSQSDDNEKRLEEVVVGTAPRVGLVPRSLKDLLFAGKLYRYLDVSPGMKRHAKQRGGIVAAAVVKLIREKDVEPNYAKQLPLEEVKALSALTGAQAKSIQEAYAQVSAVLQGKQRLLKAAKANAAEKKDHPVDDARGTGDGDGDAATPTVRVFALGMDDPKGVDVMKASIITTIVWFAAAHGRL